MRIQPKPISPTEILRKQDKHPDLPKLAKEVLIKALNTLGPHVIQKFGSIYISVDNKKVQVGQYVNSLMQNNEEPETLAILLQTISTNIKDLVAGKNIKLSDLKDPKKVKLFRASCNKCARTGNYKELVQTGTTSTNVIPFGFAPKKHFPTNVYAAKTNGSNQTTTAQTRTARTYKTKIHSLGKLLSGLGLRAEVAQKMGDEAHLVGMGMAVYA